MHIRRKFLEQIREQLKQGMPKVGGVWIQRIPQQRAAYPSITLYAETDEATLESIHQSPRPQGRLVSLVVTGWVRGSPDDERAEREMDVLAEQIEAVVKAPAEANDLHLVTTEFQVDEEDVEIHTVNLSYLLSYCIDEFSPGVI